MAKKKTDLEKLGLEARIRLTKTAVKERIRFLRRGLKQGEWDGKMAEKAKAQLSWHERKLDEVA